MPQPSQLTHTRQAEQRWWLAVALYVVIGVVAALQYSGPAPRPSSAEGGVSAGRALQTLSNVLGDQQQPHRTGTKENEEVRIRILGLLDELGLETMQFPFEPPVEAMRWMAERKIDLQFTRPLISIVARVPGEKRSRPVVLASHYDGAPDAPGAGDAGQCVAAILETARALKEEPLKYETWILLTDAEELGLWGAQAFVAAGHTLWGDGQPVVINFDARGDRGAVLLYETHENNYRAMQLAAGSIAYPQVSTSLMVNVYKRLPNGTDFTMFRNGGWCGWNFAVVAGADRYHTPNDNIQNLSARSVQHFAAHAFYLLRGLDRLTPAELQSLDQSQPAVFFDVLGLFLIVYPMSWNMAHLALVAVLWLICWFFARFYLRPVRVLGLLGLGIGIAAVAFSLGWIVIRGLQAADLSPRNFVTGYEWVVLVFAIISIALLFSLGRMAGWIGNAAEILQATGLCYGLLAGLACWWLPGGAYLFLWPAMALSLSLIGWTNLQRRWESDKSSTALVVLASLVPALMYAPTYVLLAQALGPRAGMVIAALVAVMMLPTLAAWGQQPRLVTSSALASVFERSQFVMRIAVASAANTVGMGNRG